MISPEELEEMRRADEMIDRQYDEEFDLTGITDPKERTRIKKREYYYRNRERILKKQRERYAKNIETERERCRQYREKNREKIRARSRERRNSNLEYEAERSREYYRKHRESIKQKSLDYYYRKKAEKEARDNVCKEKRR